MKFAAIDIGTNAVRLLLSRVYQNGEYPIVKKESLVRIPIRLGEDVFSDGKISDEKADNLVKTMIAYRYLIEAYGSLDYLACATSAMREAANGSEIVRAIKEESGIEVDIIDGRREGEILLSGRPLQYMKKSKPYMFIDVGGGSTEISFYSDNYRKETRSFDIGGIRILKNMVNEKDWKDMKAWVKKVSRIYEPLTAVGSGGNINKLFRLAGKKDGEFISYKKISGIYAYLRGFTVEERIKKLHLRPDRADVIIPASEIYLSAMKWAKCDKMMVPLVGLSDGLIHILYEKYQAGHDVKLP